MYHRRDVRLSTNIYHAHRVVFTLHVSNKLSFFSCCFCQLPIVSSYMKLLWLGPCYLRCYHRLFLSLQIYSYPIKKQRVRIHFVSRAKVCKCL